MGPAFYKEKLFQMLDSVKEVMSSSVYLWREKAKKNQPVNLISEVASILVKVIFVCSVGEDLSGKMLPYREDDGT